MRLTNRVFQLAVTIVLALLLGSVSAEATETADIFVGDVLVGVDELGRVLIAVDSQPLDGFADHCFLFTANERLAGIWSERLGNAKVVFKVDTLTIHAAAQSFVVSLAMSETPPQATSYSPHAEVFARHDGLELARLNPGYTARLLESMDVADLTTWPEQFWYDLLAPESGPCPDDSDCIAGGQGSTSCSLTLGQLSCSTTCGADQYACCRENGVGGVICRCRPCITGP